MLNLTLTAASSQAVAMHHHGEGSVRDTQIKAVQRCGLDVFPSVPYTVRMAQCVHAHLIRFHYTLVPCTHPGIQYFPYLLSSRTCGPSVPAGAP